VSDPLRIADIATYLQTTGWHREPTTWRSASIWTTASGHEVLLPPRDGMGDGELRVRELLDLLARREGRPRSEIATEIGSPRTDIQTYQLDAPAPDGLTALPTSLRALNGVHHVLESAARALIEGPHVVFRGPAPAPVRSLLAGSRLSTGGTEGSVLRVFVPAADPAADPASEPAGQPATGFGRRVALQLRDAVDSAGQAAAEFARAGELSSFDDAVTAGVSANLCSALSDLGGPDRTAPFTIGFTWARGLPSRPPPATIRVNAGGGARLAAGAKHLRRLTNSGRATVTGTIESLHDDLARGDRWRVKVRGEVTGTHGVGSRRTLWLRLDSPSAYDLAIRAHRERQPIRAEGTLQVDGGRLELRTARDDFRRA
jgi:hypothetical protein